MDDFSFASDAFPQMLNFLENFKFIFKGDVWMPKPGCLRLSSRWWTLPPQPHPLTGPSSEERETESAVNTSCFPLTDRGWDTLISSSPLPLFLLEERPHLFNPHFFLTLPPLWLASLFSLLFNKRNKGGRTTFPLSPLRQRRRRGGERPIDRPFQSCKDQAKQNCVHSKFLHQHIQNMQTAF